MEVSLRDGAINYGHDYEFQTAALFSIRLAFSQSVEDFWIGSNVAQVDNCDDVVIVIKLGQSENLYALLMQLKHNDNSESLKSSDFTCLANSKNNNFSLYKYQNSYDKLICMLGKKSDLQITNSKFIELLHTVDAENVRLILYTNRKVVRKGQSDGCRFLQESIDDDFFCILNTNGDQQSKAAYTFDGTKLKNKYEDEFLGALWLYPCQAHSEQMIGILSDAIKNIFKYRSFQKIDFDDAATDFFNSIKHWIQRSKVDPSTASSEKIYKTLSRKDIKNLIADILLKPYRYSLNKEKFSYYTDETIETKIIWNQIVRDKKVTVVVNSKNDEKIDILQFCRDYVGTEVKELAGLCNYPSTWGEKLSENAQKLLFKNFSTLETTINIISSNNKTDLYKLYRFAWFEQKVPLLVHVKNQKEYQDVLNISKRCGLAILVIGDEEELFGNQDKNNAVFKNLSDLIPNHRNKLLNHFVTFQGRTSVKLQTLMVIENDNEKMLKLIKCKDIINILCKTFDIGPKCERVPEPFIERFLPRILLPFSIVEKCDDADIFFIETQNKEFFDKYKDNCNVNVVLPENANFEFLELTKKKKTIHRLLHYNDEYLEWKESTGNVETLRNYRDLEETKIHFQKINVQKMWYDQQSGCNKLRVISACSGMGKSVLIDFLAWHTPEDVMSLKINLRQIADDLEKPEQFFQYYKKKLFGNEETSLCCHVYDKLVKLRKVCVLLDGFNETTHLHENRNTALIKFLVENNIPTWITTQENKREYLENEFHVLAHSLMPLTVKDQRNFLIKFYRIQVDSSKASLKIIAEFVKFLLDCASKNLSNRDREFTDVPLQIYLLANGFLQNCRLSVQEKKLHLEKRFDLVSLYERFFQNIFGILYKKFGKTQEELQAQLKDSRYMFAIKYVFGSLLWKLLNLNDKFIFPQIWANFISEQFQKEGIMTVNWEKDNVKVEFRHPTFADFLAARWLVENFKSKETVTIWRCKLLFEERLKNLDNFRFFGIVFDQLISENPSFHWDVINLRFKKIQDQVQANSQIWEKTDNFGRNALHMLVLYGSQFNQDEFLKIFTNLKGLEHQHVMESDCFKYNAFDYCFLSKSFEVTKKLCKHNPIFYEQFFNYSLKRYLLIGVITNDNTLEHVYEIFNKEHKEHFDGGCSLNNMDSKKDVKVAEYLQECGIKSVDYYTDIRFATAFGTLENIKTLLEKNEGNYNINEFDPYHRTTLVTYAALHGQNKAFDFFLEKGGDVNIPGWNGNTAFHWLAIKGYDDLIEKCIKSANFDQLNDSCNTALSEALINERTSTAMLLTSHLLKDKCQISTGISCQILKRTTDIYRITNEL